MQGAFCVLNANAKSQTRKSMKINVICTVHCVHPLGRMHTIVVFNWLHSVINSEIFDILFWKCMQKLHEYTQCLYLVECSNSSYR